MTASTKAHRMTSNIPLCSHAPKSRCQKKSLSKRVGSTAVSVASSSKVGARLSGLSRDDSVWSMPRTPKKRPRILSRPAVSSSELSSGCLTSLLHGAYSTYQETRPENLRKRRYVAAEHVCGAG
eukprot:560808-Amphidinium_carterae.1